MLKRDPSRFLQIGFLSLLFLCVIQVGWWIFADLRDTRKLVLDVEAIVAGTVDPVQMADRIAADGESRSNRYFWEGAFFLAVLVAGMAVMTRTIRHDAELRRRQQNFLAAVSHEFKSPLASTQLAAETLVMRSPDPDSKRLGQRVLEDCERLLRMVDNLLDTTRIEEGRHTLTTESVLLEPAIASCLDTFAERATRHGIGLVHSAPVDLTLTIDRTAFDTMLRNLVDNALKACVAGDGHRIEVRAETHPGRIRLSVADDGLGFPPDEAGLMFDKFHRLGDELQRKTPGTGLGLYIVKRLAEMSGAEIEATSAGPQQGATMTLIWPAGDNA
jgi:signal transduction histidine kinase